MQITVIPSGSSFPHARIYSQILGIILWKSCDQSRLQLILSDRTGLDEKNDKIEKSFCINDLKPTRDKSIG
jgi:hypothetical protein